MSDSYPATLNVEIDRDRLRNYLRVKWFLAWALPLLFFGSMFGFASISNALEHGLVSRVDAVWAIAGHTAAGMGISFLIALLCYLLFSHWIASRLAASLEVTVEGSFLHVRQQTAVLSDRKLHFRSIVDYAATQDMLMRYFGIFALQMATTAGGQNTNLVIPGVKDCMRVRDVLADIDRLREHQ
jgi:hypothetical protein